MNPQPLPRKIYDKAKELEVISILLQFSGGNDEGRLNVNIHSVQPWSAQLGSLEHEVEDWAWEAYSYSGAGDGSDYGDDIDYNIENNKVTTSNWYTVRKDSEEIEYDFDVTSDLVENSSKN